MAGKTLPNGLLKLCRTHLLHQSPNLAVVVVALVFALALAGWLLGPRLALQRKMDRFFDGSGVTSLDHVALLDAPSVRRHRPSIGRRRRTDWGYWFTLRPNPGRSVTDVADKSEELADYLSAFEVRVLPTDRPGLARVEVYKRDPMPESFALRDFESETEMMSVPVGRLDDGRLFALGLGHTLIVGATGSGKGSVLWSYIMGARANLPGGFLQLYGWDPKRAEFAVADSGFESVVFEPGDGLGLLQRLVGVMRDRQSVGSRAFVPSAETPFILLVIDEFNSLMAAADAKWRRQVHESLSALLSQGRSAGIYVVAAAQQPQKDVIGPYRAHFMNRVCLRVESALEVDLVLGQGSAEAGAFAHLIPVATESNGYATAGIGYARSDGEPVPVRFRAPRVDDRDIEQWLVGEGRGEQ